MKSQLPCDPLASHTSTSLKIAVIMNYKEKFRASNSGKLIGMLFDNAEILVFGEAEDDKKLDDLLEIYKGRSAMLFPR